MYTSRDLITVLTRGGEGWSKFAWACKAQTPAEIRKTFAFVSRAAAKPSRALNCAVVFLKALVDTETDESLATTWREALAALDDVQKYPFDATKRGKKLRDIARNQRVLTAWQTAAVGVTFLPDAVLALLIIDASDASLDALLPHFERARSDADVLSSFEAMARYETPRTASLFERLRSDAATKRAASPVLAFGERFGLAKNGRFKLTLSVLAKKPAKRSTWDFIALSFDSNDEPGFSLSTGQQTRTPTSSSSWSRGVRSTLEGLPRAVATLARKGKLEWNFEEARPVKAAALVKWLSGQN
ncbi:MAG: hypothetical protein QM817_29560 [Archangium sp.]